MQVWALNTPVVFLIFNRPDTTQQVFEAISAAKPPKLLVVADGPRAAKAGEVELCEQTRRIIDQVDWPCEVLTNFAEANMGCKARVASGLDWVFEQVEEAIILEDDCLPHPDFFRFCEELLQRYRNVPEVMMVSGTNHFVEAESFNASYGFSVHTNIWGWATWRRAWQGYDVGLKDYSSHDVAWVKKFKRRFGHAPYAQKMLRDMQRVKDGLIDTWDYQWTFHCIKQGGLAIVPSNNMIQNIGVVGAHSTELSENHFREIAGVGFPLKHPNEIVLAKGYDTAFSAANSSLWKYVVRRMLALVGLN